MIRHKTLDELSIFGGPRPLRRELYAGQPTIGDRGRFLARVNDILDPQSAPGDDMIRIKRVQVSVEGDSPDGLLTMETPLRVETESCAVKNGMTTHLTYHLINEQGVVVLTTGCEPCRRRSGVYRASWRLPARLLNSGGYSLKLLVVCNENRVTYEKDEIVSFTVADASCREYACMEREPEVVQPPLPWVVQEMME